MVLLTESNERETVSVTNMFNEVRTSHVSTDHVYV